MKVLQKGIKPKIDYINLNTVIESITDCKFILQSARKLFQVKVMKGNTAAVFKVLGKPVGTVQKSKFDKDASKIIEFLDLGLSIRKIAKLYKTAYYANQQGIISPEELTEHFKSNNQVGDIHHNINRICYKHHCDILNDHCKKLVAGQSVMHQGQRFDCVVEYLEHWKDNVNHDMLPIKKMDQIIEQAERIREQDHHLEL